MGKCFSVLSGIVPTVVGLPLIIINLCYVQLICFVINLELELIGSIIIDNINIVVNLLYRLIALSIASLACLTTKSMME